jgi:AcrR family transcriptional regulator
MTTASHNELEHKTDTNVSGKKRLGGRSAKVRADVFEATLKLLVEKGFEGLSIIEIAARSGVNATSIYRRWGNKINLAVEAILGSEEIHIPVPDKGSLRADLVQLLRELRKYYQSPEGRALTVVNASLALRKGSPELKEAKLKYWQVMFDRVGEIYQRAIRRGELNERVDTRFITQVLIAPFFLQLLITGEELDVRLPERVVDLVLSGPVVRPEPGPGSKPQG